MSKRHLSKQQLARIDAVHARKGGERVRVIAQLGKELLVELADGQTIQARFRQNLPPIVTGDWVEGEVSGNAFVVEHLCERTSLLSRPVKAGLMKPLAANIDQALLVLASEPAPPPLMIDRYLAHLSMIGLPVVMVFNKSDIKTEVISSLIAMYAPLYTVMETSCMNDSLDVLKDCLTNRTSIFVGQSGVGKSSLIHALDPTQAIRIGDLSHTHQGKHTTTTAKLYHVGEADVIDSPGMYDIASWHLDKTVLQQAFKEFHAYKAACKFRNCTHTHEAICGVKDALNNGLIHPSRYENYCLLLNEE